MKRRVFGPQFIVEVLFLAAVALVVGFAGLDPIWIVLVMAVAFLLVVAFDLTLSRAARRRKAAEPAVAEPVQLEPAHVHVLATAPEPDVQPVLVAREESMPEPELEPPPAPEPIPPAEEPLEPEPPEPEPEPEPEAPKLEAVPDPEPEPEPEPEPAPEPEPEPEPEAEKVVTLPIPATPREWNVWELERLVREQGAGGQDEERTFLLVYLRDFATPEGTLPVDFDSLVRESFGEMLGAGR